MNDVVSLRCEDGLMLANQISNLNGLVSLAKSNPLPQGRAQSHVLNGEYQTADPRLLFDNYSQTHQHSQECTGRTENFAWKYFCEEASHSVKLQALEKAEHLWRAAFVATEGFPEYDVRTAYTLDNYAALLFARGKVQQAEPLCRRALALFENLFGYGDLITINCKNTLAGILFALHNYEESETCATQVLGHYSKVLRPTHALIGMAYNNLAMTFHAQGNLEFARQLYERALPIRKHHLGATHAIVTTLMENYANVLEQLGYAAKCEELRAELRGSGIWHLFDTSIYSRLSA